MQTKNIVIISYDEEYVTGISYRLAERISDRFLLHFVTDPSVVQQMQTRAFPVDTLLVEENIHHALHGQVTGRVWEITEHDSGGDNRVSKFDGADGILSALGTDYLSDAYAHTGPVTHMIDMVSVCGGAGKTLASIALAERLAESGNKVLYLSADSCQDFDQFLEEKTGSCLSMQAILAIGSDEAEAVRTVMPEIVHAAFDYVPPLDKTAAVYHIGEDDIYRLASALAQKELYDYIVLEHPYAMTASFLSRITESRQMVVVTTQTASAVKRMKRFFETIGVYRGQYLLVCGRYRTDMTDALAASEIAKENVICDYIPLMRDEEPTSGSRMLAMMKNTAEAITFTA